MPVKNQPEWIEKAQGLSKCAWTEKVLPLANLNIYRLGDYNKGYQRPLDESFVDERCEERFDAAEARTIYVSERKDGSLWVLDGQHTMELLIRNGITEWLCRVFFDLSPAEEAWRFQEYQHNRKAVHPVVQWNAEVLAGDKDTAAIDRVLTSRGVRISNQGLRAKDGFVPVSIIGAFKHAYKLGGKELLDEVVGLVIDSWGLDAASFHARVLPGLSYLLAYSNLPLDRKRLVAVLKNTTPKMIVEKTGATGGGGAGRKVALVLWELYLAGVPGSRHTRIKRTLKETPKLPKTPGRGDYRPEPHPYFA